MASASSSAPALTKCRGLRRCGLARDIRFSCAVCIRFGIVPVGAFLFEHILISNSTAISGPGAYARQVSFLANLPLVSSSSCSASGCRLLSTRSTASTSGIAETEIRSRIRGPATGCTRCSAGRAASPSPTSSGTRTRCGLPAWTCTTIRWHRSARCRQKFFRRPISCFMLLGLIAASWHFAYGIWLFSAKWGIVSGEKAQKRLLGILPGVLLRADRRGAGQPDFVPFAPAATVESGTMDDRQSNYESPVKESWQLRKSLS